MSQSETKTMPEAVEKNPFELFDSPWFKDATNQLCADGWPAFIVPLNIGIRQAREAYSALKAECERLEEISAQRLDDIVFTRKELRAQEDKNAALVAENEQLKCEIIGANHTIHEQKAECEKLKSDVKFEQSVRERLLKIADEKDEKITALTAENERLVDKYDFQLLVKHNEALTIENADFRTALESAQKHCVCKHNKGFEYHEEHPKLGLPKSGQRWMTPVEIIQYVLSKHDKKEPENAK